MPPKRTNPISEKLKMLINSGKTVNIPASRMKVSKELICILSDIKYPTLENVFHRTEVSYASLKSLKFAGLITDKDEADYRRWLMEIKPKSRKKGAQNGGISEAGDSDYQPEEQHPGSEGDDEDAIQYSTGDGEPDTVLPED